MNPFGLTIRTDLPSSTIESKIDDPIFPYTNISPLSVSVYSNLYSAIDKNTSGGISPSSG